MLVSAKEERPDAALIRVSNEIVRIPVKYDWKPSRCTLCCTFGHKNDRCPLPKPDVSVQAKASEYDSVKNQQENQVHCSSSTLDTTVNTAICTNVVVKDQQVFSEAVNVSSLPEASKSDYVVNPNLIRNEMLATHKKVDATGGNSIPTYKFILFNSLIERMFCLI